MALFHRNGWHSFTEIYRERSDGVVWDYIGGMILKEGRYYQIATAEGRAVYEEDTWLFYFEYRDQVGNLRVGFTARDGYLQKTEVSDYTPFGLPVNQRFLSPNKNNFTFQGHEDQSDFGINLTMMGARCYNATIGRFLANDAYSMVAPSWSGYRAFFDDPVNVTDPTGNMEATDGYGGVSVSGLVEFGSFSGNQRKTTFNDYFDANGNYIKSGGSGSQIRIIEKKTDKLSSSKDIIERPVGIKAIGKIGSHYLSVLGVDPTIPVIGLPDAPFPYMGVTNRDGTDGQIDGIYSEFTDPVISISQSGLSKRIDELLVNRFNFMSTLYHETIHYSSMYFDSDKYYSGLTGSGLPGDDTDLGRVNHLNVYWNQINHWSYSATNDSYKKETYNYIRRDYLGKITNQNLRNHYRKLFKL